METKCNTSNKSHSKSFKEIYMDWIYEKSSRNRQIETLENEYTTNIRHVACTLYKLSHRSVDQVQISFVSGLNRHPNSSSETTIQLSVDIDRTVRYLISLLEKASTFKAQWRRSEIMKQMIMRYFRFMQLKSCSPHNLLLVPTLDNEIVWQTHLLRPEMYRSDCLRLFNRVIDHSLIIDEIGPFIKEHAFLDTCDLYEERFGEQYCSLSMSKEQRKAASRYVSVSSDSLQCRIPLYWYWDKTNFQFDSKSLSNYENPFSFSEVDVILDGNWIGFCKRFMFETAFHAGQFYSGLLDRIDLNPTSIKLLKKSYERFLYMSAKYPPVNGYDFAHSTYAIDIIWHSHMQEPLKYASDCIRLVGYVIDHVPWPSMETNQMKTSCENTIDIWK